MEPLRLHDHSPFSPRGGGGNSTRTSEPEVAACGWPLAAGVGSPESISYRWLLEDPRRPRVRTTQDRGGSQTAMSITFALPHREDAMRCAATDRPARLVRSCGVPSYCAISRTTTWQSPCCPTRSLASCSRGAGRRIRWLAVAPPSQRRGMGTARGTPRGGRRRRCLLAGGRTLDATVFSAGYEPGTPARPTSRSVWTPRNEFGRVASVG